MPAQQRQRLITARAIRRTLWTTLTYIATLQYIFTHAFPRRYQELIVRFLRSWLMRIMYSRLLMPVVQTVGFYIQQARRGNSLAMRANFSRNSRTEMTELLQPSQADLAGLALGGVIVGWIDVAAGIAAKTHAGRPCVTASVDAIHFLHSIRVGDIVIIKATVNRAWNTSMEVGVRVETEDPQTGEMHYCCHGKLTFLVFLFKAFLTFVALADQKPCRVPQIVPESDSEKAWFNAAEDRRNARIQLAKLKKPAPIAISNTIGEQDNFIPDAAWQETLSSASPLVSPRTSSLIDSVRVSSDKSYSQNVQLIMPQHSNSLGVTFGGHIIRLMEQCALISAYRHTHSSGKNFQFKAASIDSLNFVRPTEVGDVICIRSYISRVWKSSLEVFITVHSHSQKYTSDHVESSKLDSWQHTNFGYMTFIASVDDDSSQNAMLPEVEPVTELEKMRYKEADSRRSCRLDEQKSLMNRKRPSLK